MTVDALAAVAPARLSIALDLFAGGRTVVDVAPGISPAEALSRNWPERWPHDLRLHLIRNGVVSEDWRSPLAPGDVAMVAIVTAVPVPLFLVTALSSATGLGLAAAEGILAAIGTAAISSALSYGVSRLLAPGAPRSPNQDTSRAYQFTGPETSYQTGGVIPVTFGRFPVGGTVLSYVVRNRGLRSELYLLLGLGEGPIAGVGGVTHELDDATDAGLPVGIWLNDQEIGTYGGLKARIGTIVRKQKDREVERDGEKFTIPGKTTKSALVVRLGPRVWTRFGTENQRPIPGFNNRERIYIVGQDVDSTTWTKSSTRRSVQYKTKQVVDAFEIGIGFRRGLFQSERDGDIVSRRVEFRYRFRTEPGGESNFGAWTTFHVQQKTTDGFVIYRYVEAPGPGRYLIELDRITPAADGSHDPDDSTWESVNEIEFRDFSYPGQALFAVKLFAMEGLAGSRPRAKVLLDGVLCWIWDGGSEENPVGTYTWTRNPFWIALECLRNTEWGMGGYLRFVRYTLSEWLDAADWADELVAEGLETTVQVAVGSGVDIVKVADADGWLEDDVVVIDPGGAGEEQLTVHEVLSGKLRFKSNLANAHAKGVTIARYHERFRFDGTFDTGGSPWEAVLSILSTCRARISKAGNTIKLVVARARPVVGMVTDGNGSEVSVTYRDWRYQPNHLVAEYLEESEIWAPSTLAANADGAVLDEISTATYFDREEFRPHTINMLGVTRAGQIRRELAWRLRLNRDVTMSARATLGLSGIVARIGEVLDVAHPVLADVSYSGRTYDALTSGANTVKLDRAVVLAPSTTYAIEVVYKTEQGETNTVLRTIATAAGSYARGATLTITTTWPADVPTRAVYALGVQGSVATPFEIIGYSLDPQTLRLTLDMEQYVEGLQDAD